MTRPLVVLLSAAFLLLPACFGEPDAGLSQTGKGKPRVTATLPSSAEPGETVSAEIVVGNPGPGDMDSVVIAFSRIGDPDLPEPIVDVGTGHRSSAVEDVTPKPIAVSQDGIIYRFAGLSEGESLTIRFDLRMPEGKGEVGNAVLVYDGAEPDRAAGTRLSTTL